MQPRFTLFTNIQAGIRSNRVNQDQTATELKRGLKANKGENVVVSLQFILCFLVSSVDDFCKWIGPRNISLKIKIINPLYSETPK